jgi:putative molybdopterin biosynthesis protein
MCDLSIANAAPVRGFYWTRCWRRAKSCRRTSNGYDQEEFTHQAIAATIAADAADVGPGLRAASAQFKLHFVPLATETYRLAGRIETRKHPAVVALINAVRTQASQLPGYAPS